MSLRVIYNINYPEDKEKEVLILEDNLAYKKAEEEGWFLSPNEARKAYLAKKKEEIKDVKEKIDDLTREKKGRGRPKKVIIESEKENAGKL